MKNKVNFITHSASYSYGRQVYLANHKPQPRYEQGIKTGRRKIMEMSEKKRKGLVAFFSSEVINAHRNDIN